MARKCKVWKKIKIQETHPDTPTSNFTGILREKKNMSMPINGSEKYPPNI